MKKTPIVLLAVVSALCAMLVMDRLHAEGEPSAAKAAPGRIGVCNVVSVLSQYERLRDVKREFAARGAKLKAHQDLKMKEIKDARKFLRDEFKPGTDGYEKQLSKIRRMSVELKVWEEMQDGQNRREEYLTTYKLHKEVIDMIIVEAKLRGLDLVLHNPAALRPAANANEPDLVRVQTVLYAAEKIDLTSTVLEKVNDAYRASRKSKDK